MIVPSVSDTTVSTRCTPKSAVMPWFHERLSAQMFFKNVNDHAGHMSLRRAWPFKKSALFAIRQSGCAARPDP